MSPLGPWWLAVTLLAAPPTPHVVVVSDGDADAAAQSRLRAAAQDGARRVGGLSVSSEGRRCSDAACLHGLLAKPDVDAVMRLHIEATGRDYAYRLELFDSMSNTPEGERVVTNACELCGLEEVGSLIEVSAVTLLERYARASAPATLSIETTPSGAEVFDNGESLGRTPLEVLVVPGNHELELKLAGHEVRHRTVLVGSAETIAMNTELLRVRPPRHWKRMVIGGSVTFLAGLGLSAGGAYLVAIDSKSIGSSSDPESGCQPDSNGNCQDLYDTLGVGAATLTLGVVHLVVGAVLVGVGLAWRHDERKVAFRFDGVRVRF